MCWSCNPYCGGCKPPKPKPIKCPVCNTYTFPELIKCKRCGTVLPDLNKPEAVMCLYIGEICTTPCNRHKKASLDGLINTCTWHSTPDNEEEA